MNDFDAINLVSNGAALRAPKYAKQKQEPMPSREELLARNSFGSVNDNKYLNAKGFKP